MLSPQALSKKIGRKILYIGTECRTWGVTDFAKAAKNARAMGFDTICPKRLDGTIKWYSTKGHLQLERQAVLSEGVGYLPFAYSYAPIFNTVSAEVATWQEVASVNDGLVVVDLEAEWNGQTGYASQLAGVLNGFTGDIILTTWADPREQAWMQLISILNPHVSAWSPQQYTNWLAAQEQSEWNAAQRLKLFPSLDITGEYGSADNPMAILKQAIVNHHPTIILWEYGAVLTNTELIKGMIAVFNASITNIDPTPIPHPPSPIKKVKWVTYIVQSGDTLIGIIDTLKAKNLTTMASWQDLYNANKEAIETAAKQNGYQNSQGGSLIFPGTQIVYSA